MDSTTRSRAEQGDPLMSDGARPAGGMHDVTPRPAWHILHVASYRAKDDAIHQHNIRGLRALGYARDRYVPRGGLAYTTSGARLDGRWVDDKSLHNRK